MPFIPETGDRTSRSRRPRVAFFGRDCTEATGIESARAFRGAGLEVLGFTFRRRKPNGGGSAPESSDVNLGELVDRHDVLRPIRLVQAGARLVRERRTLAGADLFYARNIDMCALALFARAIARSRAPVVYEVLDVQRVLTGRGALSFLLRLAERLILARIALLVVSSPAIMGRYFAPVQGYAWPWFLLEDRISGADEAMRAVRPTPDQPFLDEGGIAELCRRVLGDQGAAEAGPADMVAAARRAGL